MSRLSIGRVPPIVAPTAASMLRDRFWAHVYVKTNWSDANWTRVHYLRPVYSQDAAFPSRSQAEFIYDYGAIKREDAQSNVGGVDPFKTFPDSPLRELFVCIRVLIENADPFVSFVGVIPMEQINLHGTRMIGGVPLSAGQQSFTAFGLDYLLERRRLVGAWVAQPLTIEETEENRNVWQIDWTPKFNSRGHGGMAASGNRWQYLVTHGGKSVPVFGASISSASGSLGYPWTAMDIVKYLFHFTNTSGIGEPDFLPPPELDPPNDDPLTTFFGEIVPILPTDGQTVHGMLSQLVDRKRGIGARFQATEFDSLGLPKGDVELRLFSLVDTQVAVGDRVLPANPARETITLDSGIDKPTAVITLDSTLQYDRIVVRGGRTMVCFSAAPFLTTPHSAELKAFPLAPLAELWTDAQEVQYRAWTDDERRRANNSPVYKRFGFGAYFDWNLILDTLKLSTINPDFDQNGKIDTASDSNWWNAGKEFLPRLPLVDPSAPSDPHGSPEYVKPFALFKSPFGEDMGRWFFIEDPPLGVESGSLKLVDGAMAFDVKYTDQHYIAKGHFDQIVAPATTLPISRQRAVMDFREMVVTLAIEVDSRATVDIELNPTPSEGTPIRWRTLVIDVPEVEVWVISRRTIMGVLADGTLDYFIGSPVIRDDTQRLRDIGAVARAFYGQPRSAIEVEQLGLFPSYPIGTFLDSVFIDELRTGVQSPVTERRLDYVKRTTTIRTGFLELDVSGL